MISIDNFLKNITMSLVLKGNNISHMYAAEFVVIRVCSIAMGITPGMSLLFSHFIIDIQSLNALPAIKHIPVPAV